MGDPGRFGALAGVINDMAKARLEKCRSDSVGFNYS